jgi:hypothetical protein
MPEPRLLPLAELSRTNARTCIANTCAHACTHTYSLILSTLTQKVEERQGHLRVKDVRSSQAAADLGGQGKGGGRGAPAIHLSLATAGAILLLMNMGGQLLELLYPVLYPAALYPAQRPEEPGDGLRDAFCVHAGQSLVRMHLAPASLTSTPAGMRAARWESFVLLVPGAMLLMSLALRSACSTSLKHVLASTCAAVIALQMAIQVRERLRALAWCQCGSCLLPVYAALQLALSGPMDVCFHVLVSVRPWCCWTTRWQNTACSAQRACLRCLVRSSPNVRAQSWPAFMCRLQLSCDTGSMRIVKCALSRGLLHQSPKPAVHLTYKIHPTLIHIAHTPIRATSFSSITFLTWCGAAWDLLVHDGVTVKALLLSASLSATAALAPVEYAVESIGLGVSVLLLSLAMAAMSAMQDGGGWRRGQLCVVVAGVLMVAEAAKRLACSPVSLALVQGLEGYAAIGAALIPEVVVVAASCCSFVAGAPRVLYVEGSALALTLGMVHVAGELLCPGDEVFISSFLQFSMHHFFMHHFIISSFLHALQFPAWGAASLSTGARLALVLNAVLDVACQHPSAIRWLICAALAIFVFARSLVSHVSGRAFSTYLIEVLGGAVGLHTVEASLYFLYVDTSTLGWQLLFAAAGTSVCLAPMLMAGTKSVVHVLRFGSQVGVYLVAALLSTACVLQALASLAASSWHEAVSQLHALYQLDVGDEPSQGPVAQLFLLMAGTACVVRVADPDVFSRYVVRCCLGHTFNTRLGCRTRGASLVHSLQAGPRAQVYANTWRQTHTKYLSVTRTHRRAA